MNDLKKKKETFEETIKKLDAEYNNPEYQRKAREFIRLSSTIPPEELDGPCTI